MRAGGPRRVEQVFHCAVQNEIRRAGISGRDFHVLPTNPATPAGPQRFQHRFFRGEASGKVLGRNSAAAVAVPSLRSREHTQSEPRRAPEHFANARNFDNVYTDGNDHK